jgi:hypothetical protein
MKHLEKINTNKFYTKLVLEGVLIEEKVSGTDSEGNIVDYWGFEDAIFESDDEGTTLEEYGSAHYFIDGKVYEVIVYVLNNEGTGVNELSIEDINQVIKRLKDEFLDINGVTDGFYEEHAWAKYYDK